MTPEEPHARIGHQGNAISRVKQLALKALLIVGGVVMVASAFVVSLVFLAIGLVVVLIAGGYLWWQTREVRRQLRERMTQARAQAPLAGNVIEGEVVRGRERDADRP